MEQVINKPEAIEEQARDAIESIRKQEPVKISFEVYQFLLSIGEDSALFLVV